MIKVHGEFWDDRVDAKKPCTIGPLQPSDFNAIPRNTTQCVLANAVARKKQVNGRKVSRVWIGSKVVDVQFVDDPDNLYRYFLSSADVARVRTFDEHPDLVQKVGPWVKDIQITLLPPPPYRKLGSRSGDTGKVQGSGKGKRKQPTRHLFMEESA